MQFISQVQRLVKLAGEAYIDPADLKRVRTPPEYATVCDAPTPSGCVTVTSPCWGANHARSCPGESTVLVDQSLGPFGCILCPSAASRPSMIECCSAALFENLAFVSMLSGTERALNESNFKQTRVPSSEVIDNGCGHQMLQHR